MLDYWIPIVYNIIKVREYTKPNKLASSRKENAMDEMSNVGELLVKETQENQTRKILEILNESKSLEEAKEKVKALLNK